MIDPQDLYEENIAMRKAITRAIDEMYKAAFAGRPIHGMTAALVALRPWHSPEPDSQPNPERRALADTIDKLMNASPTQEDD